MGKRKRLNRTTDMDEALFEALKTPIPHKDTGPDPDDILAGLFDDDEEGEEERLIRPPTQGETRNSLMVELDALDRQRIEQIVQIVLAQTGEQIDFERAIRLALFVCPQDEHEIHMAYKMMGSRSREKE